MIIGVFIYMIVMFLLALWLCTRIYPAARQQGHSFFIAVMSSLFSSSFLVALSYVIPLFIWFSMY
ncbi:hypothetical protein LMG33818_002651 [Halomonadaceae bacterium LMG 33818]